MQKKLIALAIAGLSSAAFAQSNVTVYGVADLTQEYAKADGATTANSNNATNTLLKGNIAGKSRLQSNSSYIGFKGAESLGNGLTAVFQIETTVTPDAATATSLASRDSYVGIAGGFGTVAAGTLTHPIRAMGAKVDFNPGASSAGFTGSMYGEVLGVKAGSDERATNAVAYITPNFSGFSGVLAYVNLENALNGDQNTATANNVSIKGKAWQIAGQYENGPLYVGLAWDKHTDPQAQGAVFSNVLQLNAAYAATLASTAVKGNDELQITRLAAKYSFPTGTSVSALWDRQKYKNSGSTVSNDYNTDATRTAYMLGANQNFGASNVWLQYAVAKDVTGGVCSSTNATIQAQVTAGNWSCGESGAKQWTLGYSYDLSKRTMIHALYSKITNDKSAVYDNYVGGVGMTGGTAGADTTVYGVGLRHTF